VSVQATTWVWECSESTGSERLILLAIADAASAEGEASMQAVSTLARMCRVDRRTVQRHLRALEERGEIESMGVSPRYQTTVYRLPGVGGRQSAAPGRQYDAEGAASTTQGGVTGAALPQTTNPKKPITTSPSTKVEEFQSTESFDDWWAIYPKKVGKQAALKTYLRIVKTVDPACVLSGLVAQEKFLVDQKARGFCPDPASWLNAGRWDDEVTPRQEVRPPAGSPEWYEWREQRPGENHEAYQLRLNGGSWD
jgi:hypothetical protein